MSFTHLSLLLALAVSGPPTNSASGNQGPVIQHCFVSLIDDVQVSAQVDGLVISLPAIDGQVVQRSKVLAQLDDNQPQMQKRAAEAELKAALARANDDIEVRYSGAAHRVAVAEYESAVAVNRKVPGTVPTSEVRRLNLTQHRARLQIDRSRMEAHVAKLNAQVNQAAVDAAQAAIVRHQVLSPVDGLVVSVQRQVGEWVRAGEPVVRVARMNRLRVEGFLSASQYNPNEVSGRPVAVIVELARGQRVELDGRVTFVSPLVQAGNRYRVRAEVENRVSEGQWILRPGMTGEMRIDVGR